ncbi:hypothetical protein PHYBLDRAFT_168345 [Phycomyces blakesleeanus NRRL 1555(-)]|uniref:Uncharacterized protein n=1 Tax=Phycomyces blakesleeanus (strain ATCC 8743b / DSM 1359 / FGSC 10004 / NBRC 33097 / NRRL 1555) TaxID=763407 RepID=A0A163DWZ6_PHYB8|nr:hypothetical protein PHYBLDRAFT_168345 [Phycomyces blakesleeanus NRRL 1555(-)]OAD73920.1 hypothetical protein PHYBLDRAFT_168345 [Phycomyces blakesleeanus NRRL 1555(-)]|eukprot:XP_018291960.1 hypothetical protein PHYBLDRAFT_168345 [Phycomyces blakesleeanus NRRL 1555(-)]
MKIRIKSVVDEDVSIQGAAMKKLKAMLLSRYYEIVLLWFDIHRHRVTKSLINHCKCTDPNCLEDIYSLHFEYRLWNRDIAAVLNFRNILKNLRYDGTIPVEKAKKNMFWFDCKRHGGVEIGASLKFNYKTL